MRDLVKHPITIDEMRHTLDAIADELERNEGIRYGTMRPLILRAASARLLRLQFAAESERPTKRVRGGAR